MAQCISSISNEPTSRLSEKLSISQKQCAFENNSSKQGVQSSLICQIDRSSNPVKGSTVPYFSSYALARQKSHRTLIGSNPTFPLLPENMMPDKRTKSTKQQISLEKLDSGSLKDMKSMQDTEGKDNKPQNFGRQSHICQKQDPGASQYLKGRSILNNSKWSAADDVQLLQLVKSLKKDWKKIRKKYAKQGIKVTRQFLKTRTQELNDETILKRRKFSHEEDLLLVHLINEYGLNWHKISLSFKFRDHSMLKNRYYQHIRKKNLFDSLLNEAQEINPIVTQTAKDPGNSEVPTFQNSSEGQQSISSPFNSEYFKINGSLGEDYLHMAFEPILEDDYSWVPLLDITEPQNVEAMKGLELLQGSPGGDILQSAAYGDPSQEEQENLETEMGSKLVNWSLVDQIAGTDPFNLEKIFFGSS